MLSISSSINNIFRGRNFSTIQPEQTKRQKIKLEEQLSLDIVQIYNKVVEDFAEMGQILELKDPVELYALFEYALYNGYLSARKYFEPNLNDFFEELEDLKTIPGAYTISGTAICRHTQVTLKDIMQKSDIQSDILAMFKPYDVDEYYGPKVEEYENNLLKRKNIDPEKATKEERISVQKQVDEKCWQFKQRIKSKNKYGNHVVTMAVKDGKIHFFDPTLKTIWKLSDNKQGLNSETEQAELRLEKEVFNGTNKERKKVLELLKLQETSIEEDKKVLLETKRILTQNKYLLESFYNEHEELYEELREKLKTINEDHKEVYDEIDKKRKIRG